MMPEQDSGPDRRRLHLREISDDADAPLETMGQDLRAARQRKGEDVASVSRALKIRKDYLEALEESKFDAMPGRTYALGFIRSYADYLGLDPKRSVERFKAETAGRWGQEDSKLNLGDEQERRLPQGIIILAVVLVLAIAYGGYYLTVAVTRMFANPVTAVPARLSAETHKAPASAAPPQAVIATESTPPPATSAVHPEPNAAAAAVLPDGAQYGSTNTDSRVTLRVHYSTKILVQGPGNIVYLNRTLTPGDSYKAPNIRGVTLTTPDSGAIEVIIDGNSLGFLGAKGAIAEGLSLNPPDLSAHFPKKQG